MLWKSALFGYFWPPTVENYCHIWNVHPQICIFAKFYEKIKMTTLWKSSLFGSFWAGIVKNDCHIWNQHPLLFIFVKLSEEIKMPAL